MATVVPMKWLGRALLFSLFALVLLQLFFVGRIALMIVADPRSTTFERSQAWQLAQSGQLRWSQQWRDYEQISEHLKQAVVASEDDRFMQHAGVDWPAVREAMRRNAQARDRAADAAVLRGGSTITQQLAKNLLLSGERTLLRKGQELLLAWTLEQLLGKRRILEIYLNHVEWGTGVFGAEAAARHYFGKPASKLTCREAARLAVMLPRPRYFETLPDSAYLRRRTETILARMPGTQLP